MVCLIIDVPTTPEPHVMMTKKQKIQRQGVLTAAYHDYEKGLNAYSFFKMKDRTRGEDLVQETFMKTWCYLAKGGKIVAMKAFLYHILNCLIVDEYRKHATISLDALLKKGYEPAVGPLEYDFNFDGKKAFFLIQRLPEMYQKVVQMRYVQHLSLKEMSFITGHSKTTIAVQVHRGLEKLKLLYVAV